MKILNYREKVLESYDDYGDYKTRYDREFDDGDIVCVYYSIQDPNDRKKRIEYIDDRGTVTDFDDEENQYQVTMLKDKHTFWVPYNDLTIYNDDEPEQSGFEEWFEEGKNDNLEFQFKSGDLVKCIQNKNAISDYSRYLTVGKTYKIIKSEKFVVFVVDNEGGEVYPWPYKWFVHINPIDKPEDSNMEEWIEEGLFTKTYETFKEGDKVKINKGTYKDMIGKILLINVIPSTNPYDLKDKKYYIVEFENNKRVSFDSTKCFDKIEEIENSNFEEWFEENLKVINENGVKIVQKIKQNKKPFTILKIYENKITDLNNYEYSVTQANRVLEKYNITVDEIKNSKYRKTK